MNQKAVEDFKAAFELFDRDHDGKITANEIGSLFNLLGKNVSQTEAQDLINEAVAKNSLDFSSFMTLMTNKVSMSDSEQELKEAFKIFDSDANGFLTLNELENAMKALDENISEHQLKEILKSFDLNGDGKISFEEFKQFFSS